MNSTYFYQWFLYVRVRSDWYITSHHEYCRHSLASLVTHCVAVPPRGFGGESTRHHKRGTASHEAAGYRLRSAIMLAMLYLSIPIFWNVVSLSAWTYVVWCHDPERLAPFPMGRKADCTTCGTLGMSSRRVSPQCSAPWQPL